MAKKVDAFKERGATLVALTPELPEYTGDTVESNELPFAVLTDLNLKVAEKYGLVFDLAYITEIYEKLFKLSEKNGAGALGKMALTPTYIIDRSGIIQYAFVDVDYRKRAEPSELIEALDQMEK